MPLTIPHPIHFSTHLVTPQVFHLTPLSYALVNLKPLLPGHVLVCPRRPIARYSALTVPEISDLFLTTQRVGRTIERVFKADALNIAIQDGAAAGQSVGHVHVHVIPRKEQDMEDKGGKDHIYEMMEGEEGDIGAHLEQAKKRAKFPGPDAERAPRSEEEMRREAVWLAEEMERDVDGFGAGAGAGGG